MNLVELHRIRLPIAMYYSRYLQSEKYVRFLKFLRDHVDAVEIGKRKYSSMDLINVKKRLVDQLNEIQWELKGRREKYMSNMDVSGVEGIDWRKV